MDSPGTASSATRMALLAHKNQLALARQGRDLLEQKRSALMKELLATADTVLERFDALQAASEVAQRAQAHAEATAGPEAVRAAALATPQELTLEVSAASVMGVRVPQIERQQPADAQPETRESRETTTEGRPLNRLCPGKAGIGNGASTSRPLPAYHRRHQPDAPAHSAAGPKMRPQSQTPAVAARPPLSR